MQKDKKTALITGASGGIGYELTKLFAADGYDLVLVLCSEQKLNNIAAVAHWTAPTIAHTAAALAIARPHHST